MPGSAFLRSNGGRTVVSIEAGLDDVDASVSLGTFLASDATNTPDAHVTLLAFDSIKAVVSIRTLDAIESSDTSGTVFAVGASWAHRSVIAVSTVSSGGTVASVSSRLALIALVSLVSLLSGLTVDAISTSQAFLTLSANSTLITR